MNNLPTPLREPILPDPDTEKLLDFWAIELEKLCSMHILYWAIETFGTKIALASSRSAKDGVVCSLLEGHPYQLPVEDRVHDLLLPEKWTPLTPEETAHPTFDGRAASAAMWARFHVEHLCEKNEQQIRRFRAWIVPATRGENPMLGRLPILSWIERFGVVRIAPLARWRQDSIHEKIKRDRIPCDLFLDPDEEAEQAETAPCDNFRFEPAWTEEAVLASIE